MQAALRDLASAISVLQPRLPGLLVGHTIAFAVKIVDLDAVRPWIGKDEAAVFTDDAAQRLPIPVFVPHFGEVGAVAEFTMLDGCGAEGVEGHEVGLGR
jgi:hypothetical protein